MAGLSSAFHTPETKRRFVRNLFATIADRYDLITVVLSYGQDRRWKRRLIREAQIRRNERAIDLACGTGDLALAAAAAGARAAGLDITPRMVELARAKATRVKAEGAWPIPAFLVGDMQALPFADESVDLVTTGYGLRNVPELPQALAEIARVTRAGGRLLSLDFNNPHTKFVRDSYLTYLTVVGSALGWILHRDPETYRYIPESIRRYPNAHAVAVLMREAGFDDVKVIPIFWGLMTLHVARKRVNVSAD